MRKHEKYMQRCIQLAEMGAGNVAPNPMVGCVIVYEGEIIGEGFHQKYGGSHAEVNAIESVPASLQHLLPLATLYVSLEPCAHFGKTPPCTRLIISKKIPRVVIGCRDPFKQVNGSGIQHLKEAGIEVIEPVLEKACIFLNRRFFCFHQKQRPYVILKWAESEDGYISKRGVQTKISGDIAQRLLHCWRSEEAAIMVGTNTVRTDNPELTVRHWKGNNPVRVFIDKNLDIPSSAHIMNTQVNTIIFNRKIQKEEANLRFVKTDLEGEELILFMLFTLYQYELISVLVEGGAILINHFIKTGCFDEVRRIVSPGSIGDGIAAPVINLVPGLVESAGSDRIYFYQHQGG